MTKQSRALQMAINALTNCSGFEEAIQACKEALDKTQDGDCCTEGCIKCDARCLPTQEPVATVSVCAETNLIQVHWLKLPKDNSPLYTHPKQWQGLSDDEIAKLTLYSSAYTYNDGIETISLDEKHFVKAIEAKLREKNHE